MISAEKPKKKQPPGWRQLCARCARALRIGAANTAIGQESAPTLTTGGNCTILGCAADVSAAAASYRTVIGAGASGAVDNSVTLGRSADTVYVPGTLNVATATPASAAATGVAGTVAWDASFIYVCTAANTWKRAAIATW